MSYVQKNNTGSLFKNDRKETEKHPDYTGTIIVEGVSYWLSGWIKSGAKGKFFSLAVKPKSDTTATKPAPSGGFNVSDDALNDSIPF